MNSSGRKERKITRREFVKETAFSGAAALVIGAGGVALPAFANPNQKGNKASETTYGKYFLKESWGIPRGDDPEAPVYIGIGQESPVEGWDEPITQVLRPIYKPYKMIHEGHRHSCAEILYFIGGNPMDFSDFGAEVELVMGEEGEKHIINTTTWVFIPKGVLHCPLDFKRVDKPIMFGHIMFAPTYDSTKMTG